MHLSYQALFFASIMISSGVSMPITFADVMQTSDVSTDQFQLKVNQTASLEHDTIKIEFLNVISDSRCPTDVTCVWEGEAKIVVDIMKDGQDLGDFNLTSRAGQNQAFGGYQIQVTKVDPSPTSDKKISLSDYIVTFTISKSEIPSPYKQFKSGIVSKDIQCRDGLQLVIKATDDSPACVKPSTASTLILWGWATPVDETQNSSGNTSNKIITLSDNGKSITLQKGESFLLKLGEMYNWNIEIDNQNVVSRAMNIMVVRGAQGVYDAHNPGQAVFTGVGNPWCLTSVPSCKMPSILFKLNVTVTSSDNTSSNLSVSTEKDQYAIGDPINITITNNGDTNLFPVGWGYSIVGPDGKQYAPSGVLRMMLVALTPGNSVHWSWNQMDGNGTQAPPGSYTVTSSYAEEGTSKDITNSKIVEIIKS